MKQIYILASVLMLISLFSSLFAQSHSDPQYLQVVSTENPIVIDGILDETDWLKRYDYLVFGAYAKSSDIIYTVTDTAQVKGINTDSTLTFVRILRNGLDLYISLQSTDKYVGKFGKSWEGDGLFMKIKNANGVPFEYKMLFNAGGVNPDIVFETNGPAGSGEGVAIKNSGTIANDISQIDSGYTAEMVIHLAELGYTDKFSEVEVAMTIFDPDGYTDNMEPRGADGTFVKNWWGSEWGDEFRVLRLSDPPIVVANKTNKVMVLDGELKEDFWLNAESVVIGKGSQYSTGGYYAQWSHPTNIYEDQSMATIKFVHKGTDLYIGVESNDSSVCKWTPGWEADGLFIFMTNKGEIPDVGARMEIKNMFFTATEGALAVFETNGNVPTGAAEGASAVPSGTVTHTETNGTDEGYSLEIIIHTDMFGYEIGDEVKLSAILWDIDYASADAYTDSTSDLAPNWWGTQWVDKSFEKYHMYRKILLSSTTDVKRVEVVANSYKLNQNYPNPFNPATKISYSIPNKNFVTLKIYDILGNEVTTLVNKEQEQGSYNVSFDASLLATGIYFYTLKAGALASTVSNIQTRKMLLIK